MLPCRDESRPKRFEMTITDLLHDPTPTAWCPTTGYITERALYQEQLTQQAFHDPPTGLPNRARFQERLEFRPAGPQMDVVQIAMDDFGTGYSSLSSLSQAPLDILRIDRSFVERLDRDPEGCTIVYAIMSLANALGVRGTGEGIETAEQLAALIEVECQYG
jgi:sensor c-di-GMP phosphodiesterase-like protein